MEFQASKIAISDSLCPSCGHTTAEGHRACVSCGYGFERAVQTLPYEAPELRKFIDRDCHLTKDDIRTAQSGLRKLRAKFPQVTLCTCVVDVPEPISLSEFGFWLFNQSVPNGPRLVERRLHSILLTIDTTRGEAALTLGYGLDPFVDDESLVDCLTKIEKPLRTQHYGKALKKLCSALIPVLERGFQEASQSYKEQIGAQKVKHHEPHPPVTAVETSPPASVRVKPTHSIIES